MIVTLIALLLTSTLLVFSVKKNIENLQQMEELAQKIEESLDILDHYFQRIDVKSKTNVMFDDPVVKDLLNDISECKNAVLLVANKLNEPFLAAEEKATQEDKNDI